MQAVRDVVDNEPKMQPAAPLRRPHAAQINKRAVNNNDEAASTSSSSGKNENFNRNDHHDKPKQPFRRNYNQNRDDSFKSNQNDTNQQSKSTRNMTVNKTPRPPQPEVAAEIKQIKAKEIPKVNGDATPGPSMPVKTTPPKVQENLVPKKSTPEPTKPKDSVPKPASVTEVTPTKKTLPLSPKNYLVEKLSIGDEFLLSVDVKASECRIKSGDYVCLSMAGPFEQHYQSLCEDFVLECDKDETPIKLVPGETCTYFNPEDGGWYRARCLNPTALALLDSGKIITVTETDKYRKLPAQYDSIPEFCCVLTFKGVEVGANLNCKILSQIGDGYKISISDAETGAALGEGEVSRWLPTVEIPHIPAGIPEVDRPPVTDGCRVVMVLATALDRVFVRPADSNAQVLYNEALQQVLLHAMKLKPLTEPPTRGQIVIAKFTDGNYYRALVRRTNVKANKYQIEYIEFGNIEISTLEDLYPCPPAVDLTKMPTQVSMVKLSTASTELTPPAIKFTDKIKDEEELILSIQDGRKTGPTGTLVTLTMVKNKMNINNILTESCTPDWKKFEQNGGDVVETAHIMYSDIEYATLPAHGCEIQIVDFSLIKCGVVAGYDKSDPRADNVFKHLTAKMAEYCNSELGKEPYLPKPEELCIAQMPPYEQWFRAVFMEQKDGPGGSEGQVCYLDYGNIEVVPVTLLRKMLPEFVNGYPAMGLHIEIRGFPSDITDAQLARAVEFLKIDEEGRGVLKVTKCEKADNDSMTGLYFVDAPQLISFITKNV